MLSARCRKVVLAVPTIAIMQVLLLDTAYAAEPPSKVLDAKLYKQRCLLCHSKATPEGVAQRVVTDIAPGKNPPTDITAAELKASPLNCWRRCIKCWPE